MSRPTCVKMEDHEWVFSEGDPEQGLPCGTYCQSCGLNIEDAAEEHCAEWMEESI